MYLSFYKLKAKPFQISTDPHFLWLSEKHKEALATLKYGILDNKGVILLTGDIGLGKTTLIHALLNSLNKDVITATIPDPGLQQLDFFNFIANEFNLKKKFRSKGDFLIHFSHFLNDAYLKRKKVLLIIDEAQRLSNKMFEEIRLLSNLEKQHVKLLNIFIVGQEEANALLSKKKNRALKQRITINYKLEPLTENETRDYIKYRLNVAGTNKKIFSLEAIQAVFLFSKGCPRLINIICDHAMLTGYVKELKVLTPDLIHECEQELKLPDQKTSLHIQQADKHYDEDSIPVQKTALQTHKKAIQQHGQKPLRTLKKNFLVKGKAEKRFNINLYKAELNSNYKKKKKRPFLKYALISLVLIIAVYFFGKNSFLYKTQNYFIQKISNETIVPFKSTPKPVKNRLENLDKLAELISEKQEREEIFFDLPYKTMVSFNFNSNQIDPKAYKNLDKLAELILQHSDIQVIIKGYTDSSGNYSYNQKLSVFRANMVKSYLVGKGVNPLIIKTTGIGPKDPINTNTNRKGRETNRRVEVEISKISK